MLCVHEGGMSWHDGQGELGSCLVLTVGYNGTGSNQYDAYVRMQENDEKPARTVPRRRSKSTTHVPELSQSMQLTEWRAVTKEYIRVDQKKGKHKICFSSRSPEDSMLESWERW